METGSKLAALPRLGVYLLLLTGITAVGAFFRFFLLPEIPVGLHPDEAANGLDALHALDRADFRIFYESNGGREGLLINLQAIAIQLFGISAWTLRATVALLGTLTIPAVWLLSRELALSLLPTEKPEREQLSERFALGGAFVIAVLTWHVHFSRLGITPVLFVLCSALLFAFFLRAERRHSRMDAIIAGVALGLLCYTSAAVWLLPILLLMLAAGEWFDVRTPSRRNALLRWAWFGIAAFVVALPLIGYYVANPGTFTRSARIIFSLPANVQEFGAGAAKTLGMFHLAGDASWYVNVGTWPMLEPLLGLAFLAGLFAGGREMLKNRIPLFVCSWFVLMLVPAVLAGADAPDAHAAFIAVLPISLFITYGIVWTCAWLLRQLPSLAGDTASARTLRAGLVSFLVVLTLVTTMHRYFFAWAGNDAVPQAMREDLMTAAAHLRASGDTYAARYIIVNEDGGTVDNIPAASAVFRYLSGDDDGITYLTPGRISEINPEFGATIVLVTEPPSEDLDAGLRAAFPAATVQVHDGFMTYAF
jgi:4-amino-4-deoxy-L-arabinose transferase-like glycosyltransferase